MPPVPPSRPVTGRITKVIRSRGCGFIRTPDGQDVFFHMTDLVETTLDQLDEQMVLRFNLVADAISGPRAIQVQLARPAQSRPARRTR